MTFLYRLAHRISRLKIVTLTVVPVALSCSEGERVDFLAPVPNQPVAARQPGIERVRVEPKIAAVQAGTEFQFSAVGLSATGETLPTTFDWSAESGSISSDGRFVGTDPGPIRVIVRPLGNLSKADTAVITVWLNSTDPTGILVYPQTITLEEGDTLSFRASLSLANGDIVKGEVTWSATGGQIDNAGFYVAPSTPGSYLITAGTESGLVGSASVQVTARTSPITAVQITPPSIRLRPGESFQFSSSDIYGNKSLPGRDDWTATGGFITQNGGYTAGQQEGNFLVIAQAIGASIADTAEVTVAGNSPTLQSLQVSPRSVSVAAGAVQQFSVSGTLSDGSPTQPLVAWSATGGSISSTGRYSAGSLAGTYRVIASQQGGNLADTAVVQVQPPSVAVLGIAPENLTVAPGTAVQYSASATWTNGSRVLPSLSWSASGGTISSSGVYVASGAAGTYSVSVAGGGKSASTVVNVTSSRTLSSLQLAPKPAQLATGSAIQFSAAALWSDGSNSQPLLTWSATGGTISSTGLYSAGTTAGTYRVIVSGGGKADTGSVVLTSGVPPSGNPTVTSFSVSPKSVSLAKAGSQQFQTTTSWSDGQTRPVSVTYSATGGTISMGGLYTAGQLVGSFLVIANCSCGRADTASVFVLAPGAPTLTSLSMNPKNATVPVGGSVVFAASALWSDGGTALPVLTWSASGGTVNGQGTYFAGINPGTYVVRVQSGTLPTLQDSAVVVVTGTTGTGTPPAAPTTPPQATVTATQVSLAVTPVSGADRYRWKGGDNQGSTSWGPVEVSTPLQVIPRPAPGSQWTCVEAGNSAGYSDSRCNSYMVASTGGTPTATLTAIELTPTNVSLSPGATRTFSVIGRMSDNSTTPVSVTWPVVEGGTLSGSTYTAGSTPGNYRVVARQSGGSLEATSWVVISAPAAPQPPPPPSNPSGLWPNEPGGFVTINETGWENAPLGQWNDGDILGWRGAFRDGTRTVGFESISDGMLGEGRALTFTYPAFHMGGGGVEVTTAETFSYPKVYFAFYFKLSGNWWGHPSSIFKLAHLSADDGPGSPMWYESNSIGNSPTTVNRIINQILGRANISESAQGGSIPRGQWHRFEAVLDMTSTPRGATKVWVNGNLVINWTGTGATANAVGRAWLSGMMGGIGPTGNPSEQKYWVDRVRVSRGN